MPAPSAEAIERLKALVAALARQTRAGRLNWKDRAHSNALVRALVDREVFKVSLPRSTITVASRPGITVTDQGGEILQEYMPAPLGFELERDLDLERLLGRLLTEIREEQRRALTALDDIIADVEGLS
ncbi:hypothetical protein [Micromonospora sp. NPDC126480]|uniref:hypothetical protein n=1 Tax=Micromonospora sp. NPDC126480 TaxID=3155312 RepID=UPI003318A0FA